MLMSKNIIHCKIIDCNLLFICYDDSVETNMENKNMEKKFIFKTPITTPDGFVLNKENTYMKNIFFKNKNLYVGFNDHRYAVAFSNLMGVQEDSGKIIPIVPVDTKDFNNTFRNGSNLFTLSTQQQIERVSGSADSCLFNAVFKRKSDGVWAFLSPIFHDITGFWMVLYGGDDNPFCRLS